MAHSQLVDDDTLLEAINKYIGVERPLEGNEAHEGQGGLPPAQVQEVPPAQVQEVPPPCVVPTQVQGVPLPTLPPGYIRHVVPGRGGTCNLSVARAIKCYNNNAFGW